jgi:hypothetical protein
MSGLRQLSPSFFLGLIIALLPACERAVLSTAEQRLSTRLESAFSISLPCSLVWCEIYLGNGIGGLIVDTKGDSLKWSQGRLEPDTRMPEGIRGDSTQMSAWFDSLSRYPPELAYVGADHFLRPGAQPLLVGSSAESLFIDLLWYVAGPDTVLVPGRMVAKRFRAANVALSLKRQRTGHKPYRDAGEITAAEHRLEALQRETWILGRGRRLGPDH